MNDVVLLTGEALLTMLPSESGGIPNRWRSGIRPNHRRSGDDFCFIGELRFEDRDSLGAGESCEATFRILVLPEMTASFVPGFRWELTIAGRDVVGHATVICAAIEPN